MDRDEALRFMGLEEGASAEEINVAYREMSQILHPDRYTGNDRLSARATEQFKRLGEARDVLLKGGGQSSSARPSSTHYDSRKAQLNARIIGIQTARESIVALRDMEEDQRRNGLILMIVGLILVVVGHRFVIADALGGTMAVWGIVKLTSTIMTIRAYDDRLSELDDEKKACVNELEKL